MLVGRVRTLSVPARRHGALIRGVSTVFWKSPWETFRDEKLVFRLVIGLWSPV